MQRATASTDKTVSKAFSTLSTEQLRNTLIPRGKKPVMKVLIIKG